MRRKRLCGVLFPLGSIVCRATVVLLLVIGMLLSTSEVALGVASEHTQEDAVEYALSLVGTKHDYDGTGYDCVDIAKYYYRYLGEPVETGNGWTYTTGHLPSGWTRVYSDPQPGDVAAWGKNAGMSSYGHVAIVVSVNGSKPSVVDQSTSQQRAARISTYNATPTCYLRPNFKKAPDLPFRSCIDNPTASQSFSGNLYVKGWAIGSTSPTDVVYSINGGKEKALSLYYREDVHNAYPDYPTASNGWQGTIPNAEFPKGTNTITFTAIFDGYDRHVIGSRTVNNTYNGTSPTVSDVQISNVSVDGYTVTCKVTASNGLSEVLFPTWTNIGDSNGQDDITWDSKAVSGNEAIVGYNVKVSAHGGFHGLYSTHVYVRDKLGYEASKAANNVLLPSAMASTNDSTYILVDTAALRGDWFNARDVVASSWQGRNLGAHLVAITSQEEQDAVAALAYSRNGYRFGYWMGLNDIDGDGFCWTSGEAATYTNWAPDQPAVADNKHYGALMWETGLWENLTRTATSSGYVIDGYTNLGFIMEVPDGGSSKAILSDPSISYDSDGGGFTVSVKVADGAGVTRVQFPTWAAADQSDIKWYEGTIANGRSSYHVPKSDFGHKGPFHVHAYARDAADNAIGVIGCEKGRVIMLPAGKATLGDHTYYVVDKAADFATAQAWAGKYHGDTETDGMSSHLVTIDSAEEQQVVAALAAKADANYAYHWIGLTDEESEGKFEWVTGEALEYTNWASGEPNGGTSENHVAMVTSDGTWADVKDESNVGTSLAKGYIVEMEPSETDSSDWVEPLLSEPAITYDSDGEGFTVSVRVAEDSGVASVQFPVWTSEGKGDVKLYDATIDEGVATAHVAKADFGHKGPYYVQAYARDASGNVLFTLHVGSGRLIMLPAAKETLNGHVYYAVDKMSTYETAKGWADVFRGDAETDGMVAHLVTVNSAEEQRIVASVAAQASYPYHWIGLTDEESEGAFAWVTGEELAYTNWASGEPGGGTAENSVVVGKDGAWLDAAAGETNLGPDLPIGYIVELEPLVANKPVAESGLVYNGEPQSGVAFGTGYTLTGTVSAQDAGSYTTVAKLNDGYTWEDGTTDDVVCTWQIAKSRENSVVVHDLSYTYDAQEHELEEPTVAVEGSTVLYSLDGNLWTEDSPVFYDAGTWTVYVKAQANNYEDTEVAEARVTGEQAVLTAKYQDETIREGETPSAAVTLTGLLTDYEEQESEWFVMPTVAIPGNLKPGTYTLTPGGGESTNYRFEYVAGTLTVLESSALPEGWYPFPDGAKGYVRNGALVKGWMDLNGAKYWFDGEGKMATGWTDVVVDGKTMHYYFNPASGNLARGTWMEIDGKKYYFRPSGNKATGWATIDDAGVEKKYYFDGSGQMVTGWADIANDAGVTNHYYFRPSGAMATGWAQVDGVSYYFRPSGNMATGFTDVADDAYKRYFDGDGRMLTGWQQINGQWYYFRASGAMQTGTATIGGKSYTFSDKGVLVSGTAPAMLSAPARAEAAPDAAAEAAAEAEEAADAALSEAVVGSDAAEAETEVGPGAAAEPEPDPEAKADPEPVASGECGTCAWSLGADGVLEIAPADGSGEGELAEAPADGGDPALVYGWLAPEVATLVREVRVRDGVRAPCSLAGALAGLDRLEVADLSGFDVSGAEDLSCLLEGCASLRELDLSGWALSSLESSESFAEGCGALERVVVTEAIALDVLGIDSTVAMLPEA